MLPKLGRCTALFLVFAGGTITQGAVLYSNLQGNYLSQQTGTYTVNKGTYTTGGPNNGYSNDFDLGSSGLGDDYTVDSAVSAGAATVPFQAISFYGDIEPTAAAANPPGALGSTTQVAFYNSAKQLQQVVSINLEFQGNGLHTYSLANPINIPSNGFIGFSPSLYSTFNLTTGVSTPKSNGNLFITGDFGAAPTVGTSTSSFVTIDTNRVVSVQSAPLGSLGDFQFALYSTGVSTPEPCSAAASIIAACGLIRRRNRPAN